VKQSKQIKDILIMLASEDKLPLDMNDLDESVFDVVHTPNDVIKVPQTYTVLDVSTGHMTEKDNNLLLENPNSCSPLVHPYEGGMDVLVPDNKGDLDFLEPYFSREFFLIIKYAYDNGYRYVQFDRDGPVYLELTKFDW
jgi:hypothetical protein